MAPMYPRPIGAPTPRRNPIATNEIATTDRAPVPVRRYDVLFLDDTGQVDDFHRMAPATPAFEATCGAFAHGTLIQTDEGEVPVEDLLPGMKLHTRDGGMQPLLWIGAITIVPGSGDSRVTRSNLTRITEGSIGLGRPARDLVLGPYARILRRNAACQSLFGTEAAFAPAHAFTDNVSIIDITPASPVRLFHLALDGQHVITANQVEVESFHPGRRDATGVPGALTPAFVSLFPHVESMTDFGPMRVPRLSGEDIRALEAT